MRKVRIEEVEYFHWECPYKKCNHRNETFWYELEELKNGGSSCECSECGNRVQLIV